MRYLISVYDVKSVLCKEIYYSGLAGSDTARKPDALEVRAHVDAGQKQAFQHKLYQKVHPEHVVEDKEVSKVEETDELLGGLAPFGLHRVPVHTGHEKDEARTGQVAEKQQSVSQGCQHI